LEKTSQLCAYTHTRSADPYLFDKLQGGEVVRTSQGLDAAMQAAAYQKTFMQIDSIVVSRES
jgi:hypothetical protein